MKNRWGFSSHLCWQGPFVFSRLFAHLSIHVSVSEFNLTEEIQGFMWMQLYMYKCVHVCVWERDAAKEPASFQEARWQEKKTKRAPKIEFFFSVSVNIRVYLLPAADKNIHNSCRHVHIWRHLHTQERSAIQLSTTNRKMRNLHLKSFGIWAALFRQESILCFRDRELNPEPKSHAVPRLVRQLVQYSWYACMHLPAVECTDFASSLAKLGLSFLCWAQVSLHTYMSTFSAVGYLQKGKKKKKGGSFKTLQRFAVSGISSPTKSGVTEEDEGERGENLKDTISFASH